VLLPPLPIAPQKAVAQWRDACNDLPPGATWYRSEIRRGCLVGVQPRCFARLQNDGNLVLYYGIPRTRSSVLWASNTNGRAVEKAAMQADGNFVLYGYDGVAVWATNTEGNPGAWLILQEGCNLVIYKGRTPIWATNTNR
jgi:hypothetical protein